MVCFVQTFCFVDTNPDVNNALHIIWDMVLKVVPVAYPMDLHVQCHMQLIVEFYNMPGEPEDDDELQNINILERGGSRDIVAPNVPSNPMSQSLKLRKVNIGT